MKKSTPWTVQVSHWCLICGGPNLTGTDLYIHTGDQWRGCEHASFWTKMKDKMHTSIKDPFKHILLLVSILTIDSVMIWPWPILLYCTDLYLSHDLIIFGKVMDIKIDKTMTCVFKWNTMVYLEQICVGPKLYQFIHACTCNYITYLDWENCTLDKLQHTSVTRYTW